MEKIEIKYSIKNSLLKIIGNLVFVFLGFYLLKLVDFRELKNFKIKDYIIPLVSILFIFYYGKYAIIEFLNCGKKMVFSKNGIELNKKLFEWNDIKKHEIISKKESTPKYRFKYLEFYLKFQYKGRNIEFKIDDYKTSVEEINKLVKKFSKY